MDAKAQGQYGRRSRPSAPAFMRGLAKIFDFCLGEPAGTKYSYSPLALRACPRD